MIITIAIICMFINNDRKIEIICDYLQLYADDRVIV